MNVSDFQHWNSEKIRVSVVFLKVQLVSGMHSSFMCGGIVKSVNLL